MLKKLRRRFVLTAAAAFAIVMLLLLIGINGANLYRTRAKQNEMLVGISEYSELKKSRPEKEPPSITQMPWVPNPEGEFTTRFFVVHCADDGSLHVFDREYISSIDEQTAESYAEAVLKKGRDTGNYEDYRYLIKRTDGGKMIVFLNIASDNTNGRTLLLLSAVIGFAGILLVLALVMLFSEKAVKPYARNMEQQKRFITDAGHELKTPITSITTSADILSMDIGKNEWLDNIKKQSARLSKLTSDLVALSRLDEANPFPEKQHFSLSEAAWEIAEPFAVQAKAAGKTYQQLIENDIIVNGDRESIQKLISILLDNALRYSDYEGNICLSISRQKGKAVIEVSNTCVPGAIPEPERLFDRFYRPDESRSAHAGGSGIGLSIAKSITENHGGSISVSEPAVNIIRFRAVI